MDIRRWDLWMCPSSHRWATLMASHANTECPTDPPTNKRPLDPVESQITEVDLDPDDLVDVESYNGLLKRMRALEAENERLRIETTTHTLIFNSLHAVSRPEFFVGETASQLRERLGSINVIAAPDMRGTAMTDEEVEQWYWTSRPDLKKPGLFND